MTAERAAAIFRDELRDIQTAVDQSFGRLLVLQWAIAIAIALWVSPYGWTGTTSHLHVHVWAAVVFGAVIDALPVYLITRRPGWWGTRHAIAVAQIAWSGLLISITGGRIETHFHIFGSLAFLAAYRDNRILATAVAAVGLDHAVRGLMWPESVYGLANPEWWRLFEHTAWVLFEAIVLGLGIRRSRAEMRVTAGREAELEVAARSIAARADELSASNAALEREMKSRSQAEAELRQAQKLEAVGRLASGVAHEINTPVQFVTDSAHFVQQAVTDLARVIGSLQVVQRAVLADAPARDAAIAAVEVAETADLDYVLVRAPKALDRMRDGLDRVATIVRSLKVYAHPDSPTATEVDLAAAIDSTLVIARNEYKYVADVEVDLARLPLVRCYAGDLNQAILNIVVNAAHAIDDAVGGTDRRGKITVRLSRDGDHAVIAIADTGTGIPEAIRDRIFDPFFTTKPVGKGTGQGLAIVRSVIADKHHGSIAVDTGPSGTTFTLRIPIEGPREIEDAA
jgi:signal transduction histidine kinase